MLTKFQKTIIFSLVFCLMFGLVFNIFIIKPKSVEATDGGAGWVQAIKDLVLDAVGWAVTDQILQPLKQKIQDWGMGKTSDDNKPFFVIDWKEFANEALDVASARFIEEVGLTKLCGPLRISIGQNPLFTTYYTDQPKYKNYAACTLDSVISNVDSFLDNPSISVFGWNAWSVLTQPNNNFLGAYLLASQRSIEIANEEAKAKDKEVAASGGVKNETTTNETDTDACLKKCDSEFDVNRENNGQLWEDCTDKCETTTKGVPTKSSVKNLGSTIKKNIDDALGADMSRIISADEISELVGVFFSAVINKAIDGLGLVPSSANKTAAEESRDEMNDLYSYGDGSNEMTEETKQNIRLSVLNGMLKGVQMISRSTAKCEDEDTMITDLDFNKNISDIYSAQLEALYVGTAGVNLKPDFIVLDSPYAPFSLYGYGWSNIPGVKMPAKCKKITAQAGLGSSGSCTNIVSGLEPNYSPNCKRCIYDGSELNCPPAPYPPFSSVSGDVVTPVIPDDATILAKQDFYNKCMEWYDVTKNRCSDCVKKADAKCNQGDEIEKQACIEDVCNNYDDLKPHVASTITSSVDFYNKCLLEEKKSSCFTCLKEYFMPASYCDTMTEFTARSLIKYPAVVLATNVDDGRSVGRYDSTFQEAFEDRATECNNDKNRGAAIEVSLICRIMPEFKHNGIQICRQYCMGSGMTEIELNDILDNRPTDGDCNNKKIGIGGSINVWDVVKNGNFQQLSKCCAATNTTSVKKYSTCIGASQPAEICTYAVPPEQEPWCYCSEGYRPLGFTRTGFPRSSGLGGDCSNTSVIDWTTSGISAIPSGREVYIYTSNQPVDSDIYYIAKGECTEKDNNWENATGQGLEDGQVDEAYHNFTMSEITQPSSVICSGSGANSDFQCNEAAGQSSLNLGVYHTQLLGLGAPESSTGVHMCAKCESSDSGYPSYGYKDKSGYTSDQCTGKQ